MANDKKTYSCDGDKDSPGHPKVYLEPNERGEIVCPYCGKKFEGE